MARFSSRLPEPLWIVIGLVGMGAAGILYGLSTSIPVAIVLVMISGFFNSPSSVARSVLLQRNTPREMRGRVFSAFYVMRDIIFLIGMAGAGLADVVDIRLLIIVASSLLFVSAGVHARGTRPRPGHAARSERPTARAEAGSGRRRDRRSARRRCPTSAAWPSSSRPSRGCPPSSATRSCATRTIREVPAGTRVVEHGDAASSAYFILEGSATAGIPDEGGYRGLSTMVAGDFFGEIAALTGSPRTADVVADTDLTLLEVPAEALRATMAVPEIQQARPLDPDLAAAPDRGGRPAAAGRHRPGVAARPAHAPAERRGAATDPSASE